jgi:hypothetical protein
MPGPGTTQMPQPQKLVLKALGQRERLVRQRHDVRLATPQPDLRGLDKAFRRQRLGERAHTQRLHPARERTTWLLGLYTQE